jgi:hypothetical protein
VSTVATVQQTGIAFGAAIAGLIANASGLGDGLQPSSVLRAAFWVPVAFVAAPLAASMDRYAIGGAEIGPGTGDCRE